MDIDLTIVAALTPLVLALVGLVVLMIRDNLREAFGG